MAEEVLSDSEIAELIEEVKLLPVNWQASPVVRAGNLQAQADVHGSNGTLFILVIRQSIDYRNNFSVILAIKLPQGRQINLLRYDGSSHPHSNRIEGNRIEYKPHIHIATERYQRLRRADAEGYAEETDRYQDIKGAWDCFRADIHLQSSEISEDTNLPSPFVEG